MNNKRIKRTLENIAQRGIPGDTNLWPEISAQLERKPLMTLYRTRPLLAVFIAVLGLLVISGAGYALSRALGYVPGVGLVENTTGIRILAEPVAVTQEGVTLTITNLIAYEDRVELVYDVKGIAPENHITFAGDANPSPIDFCGSVPVGSAPSAEGSARLQLPDGTVLERDSTGKYPQNAYAMKPVYEASLPEDVTHLTFLLDCIPQARRGVVPENWSVPLELKIVPAGTVVGAPVIEVQPTVDSPLPALTVQPGTIPTLEAAPSEAASVPTPEILLTLSKIVPLESQVAVYFHLDMEDKDPSLVSIMPVSVYILDSQGQKIQMIGNFTWQPFEHRVGSEFEFTSQVKPADGPLTLVVENAVAYYAPLYVDPQQATPDDMSFTFDAGANPQYGQTWDVDKTFEIAGYSLEVTSARAASFEDIQSPLFIDGSQGYEYGYDFAIEADPSVKVHVWMDIMSQNPACWLSNTTSNIPQTNAIHYIQLCREAYPTGLVRVTIGELSVLVENSWQATWMP